MPATARRGSGKSTSPTREVLTSGPYKGVKNTTDPFDDTEDYLIDLVNGYIPDVRSGSGAYARPGTVLMNSSNQLGGANHMGQSVFSATFSGVDYNFTAVSGKLYRVTSDLGTYTDVTPAGITIDSSTSTRVFMLEFAGTLIVSDGVNRPWIGTSLAATPIIGTNIQYDSGNSAWCAQHMTLYSGALLFVIKTIAGVWHQTRIAWSAPFDATQGYLNTVSGVAVDYTWDLVQTGSTPIYGVCGTNVALLYFRDDSIGALTGPIGPNFKNDATHDAVDLKIGTRAPATIALFGSTVFFCDTLGRPQMLLNGLQPIWLNMRSIVEASRTDAPQATQLTACGTLYAPLNLYLCSIWSPTPTINLSPNTIHAFDAMTGQYVGQWVIGPGINIETLGILKDVNGEPELAVIGTKVSAINLGFGGYVWRLTNVQENIWTDNGVLPVIQAKTQRMGFGVDVIRYADRATAITGSPAPCVLSVLTPQALTQGFVTDFLMTEGLDFLMTEGGDFIMAEGLGQATATPTNPTVDGTYRLPFGLDSEGRGFNLIISPTTATSQWRLHRLELQTVVSQAPVEEA